MCQNFKQQLKAYQDQVEAYLNSCFIDPALPQQNLLSAMRYSLLAGGKRLRPVLTLDFCRICGGNTEKAMPFAAAIEMIHTYSLIHDDLPCMDNDDYRRGKLTNHKVYGEDVAVLAGDALLTAAFCYITKADLPAERKIQAVTILADCAGYIGMVGGQILDMESESRQCTVQDVTEIHSRKTGALIRSACLLGVISAGGTDEQLAAASEFADHLGLAFQIRDDMLDMIGTAEEMGKAVGTDKSKNTFVQLYGLDRCDVLVKDHTSAAIKALSAFDERSFLTELANYLTERFI